jgi:hypothetical protein
MHMGITTPGLYLSRYQCNVWMSRRHHEHGLRAHGIITNDQDGVINPRALSSTRTRCIAALSMTREDVQHDTRVKIVQADITGGV